METIIVISIIATFVVAPSSFFAIRLSAHSPANGEVKRLHKVEQRAHKNVEHYKIISSQPINKIAYGKR